MVDWYTPIDNTVYINYTNRYFAKCAIYFGAIARCNCDGPLKRKEKKRERKKKKEEKKG